MAYIKLMIIEIPVSTLSKKILIREYPSHELSGTIVANSHSLIYRQIMARMKLHYQPKKNILTTTIAVDVNIKIHPSEEDLKMVGLMIHQEHRDAISRWIQSAVSSGQTATHGIKTFIAHYDLDEDIMPIDTRLRTWQRYVRKHIDLIGRPKSEILLPKELKTEVTFDEDRFANFIADIVEYIYVDNVWRQKIVRNLRHYILLHSYTAKEISQTNGYIPIKTIYTQCKAAERWIDKYPYVKKIYLKYYSVKSATSQHDTKYRVDKVTV